MVKFSIESSIKGTMKRTIKCWSFVAIALALCATVIFGCRCSSSKPTPDPLAGWTMLLSHDYEKLDKSIVQDYQSYINQLPDGESKFIGPIQFFKDGTGNHAVKIEIALDGTDWAHILFYDKDNKRIKVIKFAIGRYGS
jgi:hypothetical protein